MKTFAIDCELSYEGLGATTYLFNIAAREDERQHIRSESFSVLQQLPYEEFSDFMGNRFFRVSTDGGPLSVRYRADVDLAPLPPLDGSTPVKPACLPPDTLPFLLPSRYCESDRAFNMATGLFGHHTSQVACVNAICTWIRDNIRYEIGTSLPHGSAWDVLQNRTGVCRDFAHVAVALARAMNIPTRFVTAHSAWDSPPPDFHALIECHADGRWRLFDPTAMAPVDEVICIGRAMDAAQVPFCTVFGQFRMVRMSPLVEQVYAPCPGTPAVAPGAVITARSSSVAESQTQRAILPEQEASTV